MASRTACTTAPKPADFALAVSWELPGRAIGQAVWRMDRHLALIGRSPACKIRIVESDVSKFHCSVVLTPHGVWAVDLLGQKGVMVNDMPVRCARIEDGDELDVMGLGEEGGDGALSDLAEAEVDDADHGDSFYMNCQSPL